MLVTNTQKVVGITDTAKLEFYRLIGEGYKAMEDGIRILYNKVDWQNLLKK